MLWSLVLAMGACGGQALGPVNNNGSLNNNNALNNNNNTLNNNNAAPGCGDGVIQAPEQCDGPDLAGQSCASIGQGFSGGTLACAADCTFDTSACTASALCGDGVAQAPEQCDTNDFMGQTCASIGQGFDGGTLACRFDCTWDTSACTTSALCGDGTIQGSELCDTTNLGGQTCVSIGLGFVGGTLACSSSCDAWDTSACTASALCGNGTIDPPEQCDTNDLGGQSCVSIGQGFAGGTLACASNCVWDTSGCVAAPVCGDGVAQPSEQCDTSDLRGHTCVSIGQGFNGGTLACASDCTFDTSACTAAPACGDGVAQAPEQCDTNDLDGQTCVSIGQGFTGGNLACASNCTFDTSACTTGCAAEDLGAWSGTPIVRTPDTCSGSSDYSPPDDPSSCTGYDASGQEVLYALTLGPMQSVTVVYQPAPGADGSLYALTDCGDTTATTCVAGSDQIGDGVQESIALENQAFAVQTYYLVVDAYSGCGSATLTVGPPTTCGDNTRGPGELCDGSDLGGETCTSIGQGFTGGTLACAPSCDAWDTSACTGAVCGDNARGPGELCDGSDLGGETCVSIGQGFTGGTLACAPSCDAWDTSACTFTCNATNLGTWTGAAIHETGTTCTGTRAYSPPSGSGSCTGYDAEGYEVIYQLTLPGHTSATITYAADKDNSLYVLTDCADTTAAGCVVGADDTYEAPFTETVTLTNSGNAAATYFLVLDNWRRQDCGAYTLDIAP